MINRINLILRAKNITARQFAEEIGIQPSGMSHILGGRNNPSLDFVQKVIRRYPEIDANWLLMGRGEMYTAAPSGGALSSALPPAEEGLPRTEEAQTDERDGTLFDLAPTPIEDNAPFQFPTSAVENEMVAEPSAAVSHVDSASQQVPESSPAAENRELQGPRVPFGAAATPSAEEPESAVTQVIMFYADHTFEVFTPRRQ